MIVVMSVVGYFVQLIDDKVTAKDILYQQWILYPSWETALAAAAAIVFKYANNDDENKPICTIRATSKSTCHSMGYVTAYRLESKDVIICPVVSQSGA